MIIRETVEVGGRPLTLEVGRVARQAHGSVLITNQETVVLVTACAAPTERAGIDFFPLTCEYLEKTFAAGKIPGGFFKREGRLRDDEVLTARMMDRPIRPLFPKGFKCETQVIATVLSADKVNPSDVLAMCGASASLMLSDIPWNGPLAAIRVGYLDGDFVANPTFEEQERCALVITMAASKDAVVMVEGHADQAPEELLVDALMYGQQAVQPLIALQEKLREAVGLPKRTFAAPPADPKIAARVAALATEKVRVASVLLDKRERYGRQREIEKETVDALKEEFPDRTAEVTAALDKLKKKTVRDMILDTGKRIDGRGARDIRKITCEVGVLPRTHGSSLFTRGETQAIVVTTLGTAQDEQKIDNLLGERWKAFMLHYNFPPYSVGETKMLRGPSRREVGHGNLAERALSRIIPSHEEFPYTIRIVSEILESNGSSSMASVCGGCHSLMDAGVPIKTPVAGIAMGLIKEGDRMAILSDILGDEDHLGDMDFKVCGTKDGVTAIQMDIKIAGLSREILQNALSQAKEARLHVLGKMLEALAEPRKELSKYAPRIVTIKVKPDQIRLVIGPGGKTIKGIIEQTGVSIDVEDDGTVAIASSDSAAVQRAIDIVKGLTQEPEIGTIYKGTVKSMREFGAFIEILPNKEGLLHVSEMAWVRVRAPEDICKEGDEIEVKVVNVDREGKIRLSRRELLPKPEGYVEPPPRPAGERSGSDRGRRDGRRDSRPRHDRGR